ncbi:MAG: nucleotide-binding protein [candidate division Zixibacteria bacterium]|nr:nucleotide-binding protein [candidate division Zixibacteria bacterium]
MQFFLNRKDNEYMKILLKELNIERLIQTSFPVEEPKVKDGKTFNRCCRIDYLGATGTTLLDIGGNYFPPDAAQALEKMFLNVKKLNDAGIFVKVRFLFVYPYSDFSFAAIQAEHCTNRASINQPQYLRDFNIIDEVDEKTFYASSLARNLSNSLEHLQHLVELPGWGLDKPNVVLARFVPQSINVSVLMINNIAFCDSYLYAKDERHEKCLSNCSPLVMVDKQQNEHTFKGIEDHFRYLWELDTTLDCEDATFYSPGKCNSLKEIKNLSQITYKSKAGRIRLAYWKKHGREVSDRESDSWRFKVRHLLARISRDTKTTPSYESLFIACSWEIGRDGKSRPNKYAEQLSHWLESDFGQKRAVPLMSVHVMEAATGESLAGQLYSRLRESTLAIILLTADIHANDDRFYSRPNVYHELGYLMRHLDYGRLAIVYQAGVSLPSNIGDIVNITFDKDKLAVTYREIVRWLHNTSAFASHKITVESFRGHKERMQNMVLGRQLTQDEGDEACKRIDEEISKL